MKYKVLYDTLINKVHYAKGDIIEFEKGTDEGYIKRLVNKVITPADVALIESKNSKEKSQERIILEERAKELNIKFQDNIKDETLSAKIAKVEQSLKSKDS